MINNSDLICAQNNEQAFTTLLAHPLTTRTGLNTYTAMCTAANLVFECDAFNLTMALRLNQNPQPPLLFSLCYQTNQKWYQHSPSSTSNNSNHKVESRNRIKQHNFNISSRKLSPLLTTTVKHYTSTKELSIRQGIQNTLRSMQTYIQEPSQIRKKQSNGWQVTILSTRYGSINSSRTSLPRMPGTWVESFT